MIYTYKHSNDFESFDTPELQKYNGNIIKLTDVFKDRRGEYHDSYIYEILN